MSAAFDFFRGFLEIGKRQRDDIRSLTRQALELGVHHVVCDDGWVSGVKPIKCWSYSVNEHSIKMGDHVALYSHSYYKQVALYKVSGFGPDPQLGPVRKAFLIFSCDRPLKDQV